LWEKSDVFDILEVIFGGIEEKFKFVSVVVKFKRFLMKKFSLLEV